MGNTNFLDLLREREKKWIMNFQNEMTHSSTTSWCQTDIHYC